MRIVGGSRGGKNDGARVIIGSGHSQQDKGYSQGALRSAWIKGNLKMRERKTIRLASFACQMVDLFS